MTSPNLEAVLAGWRAAPDAALYVWRPGELPPFSLVRELAPGVWGYACEYQGATWIPVLEAVERGKGHVGRYLDSLPRDHTIVVPTVLNPVLAGMLHRRGFTYVEMVQHGAEGWIREAAR